MLEVLVTILVMSFGFLSLASFQMGTLKHLSGTNQHYLATVLASSMGESMNANPDEAGEYIISSLKDYSKDCTAPNGCSTAESDLMRWKAAFAKHTLQDLDAEISINGLDATIVIKWKEKATNNFLNENGSEDQSYSLQVPLS